MGAQFIVFIVLARYLGIQQFGYLMAVTAATQLGLSLCGLGGGEAMLRRVSRDPSTYPAILGHNIVLIASTGVILSVLLLFALPFMLHVPTDQPHQVPIILLLLVPTNVVLFRWINLVEQIMIARQAFMSANIVVAGFSIIRAVGAVVACMLFGVVTLEAWCYWHAGICLASALAATAMIVPFGRPKLGISRDELSLGISFSSPVFFSALRQNADFLSLSAFHPSAMIGGYPVARRLGDQSGVFVSAFLRIAYPRLAIAGQSGIAATLNLARRYLVIALLPAIATSLGLFVFAPWLPLLLGHDFDVAIVDLRILCWLLILITIKNVAYDGLGGAERHRIRAVVVNIGSIASALLIAGATYSFGLNGTFVAVYVSELLLGAALWITFFWLYKNEERWGESGRLVLPERGLYYRSAESVAQAEAGVELHNRELLDSIDFGSARDGAKRVAGGPSDAAANGGAHAVLDAQKDFQRVSEELDRWAEAGLTANFWIRDDDAIDVTPQLRHLKAVADEFDLSVGLAAIPGNADKALADFIAANDTRFVPMCHGWKHINHGSALRPAEFGSDRPISEALEDINKAFLSFKEEFNVARPIFVPPYNRISRRLVEKLPNAGFAGLSMTPGFIQANLNELASWTGISSLLNRRGPLPRFDTHIDPIVWAATPHLKNPSTIADRTRSTVAIASDRDYSRRRADRNSDAPFGPRRQYMDGPQGPPRNLASTQGGQDADGLGCLRLRRPLGLRIHFHKRLRLPTKSRGFFPRRMKPS